jgi:hypothetical protein
MHLKLCSRHLLTLTLKSPSQQPMLGPLLQVPLVLLGLLGQILLPLLQVPRRRRRQELLVLLHLLRIHRHSRLAL